MFKINLWKCSILLGFLFMLRCKCSVIYFNRIYLTWGDPSISSITRQLGRGSDSNTDFIWVAASNLVLNTSALLSSLVSKQEIEKCAKKVWICTCIYYWNINSTQLSSVFYNHSKMLKFFVWLYVDMST